MTSFCWSILSNVCVFRISEVYVQLRKQTQQFTRVLQTIKHIEDYMNMTDAPSSTYDSNSILSLPHEQSHSDLWDTGSPRAVAQWFMRHGEAIVRRTEWFMKQSPRGQSKHEENAVFIWYGVPSYIWEVPQWIIKHSPRGQYKLDGTPSSTYDTSSVLSLPREKTNRHSESWDTESPLGPNHDENSIRYKFDFVSSSWAVAQWTMKHKEPVRTI